MPETWIDEHTGDETVARAGFQADLRSMLAAELDAPAKRNTPWRAIGWASVAAAAAVATVVVATNNDGGGTVTPATDPTTVTNPDTSVPFRLRDRIVDVKWVVLTRNAEQFGFAPLPFFTLQDVGRLVGFDGCNQYGFDTSDPGGWMLDGEVLRIDQQVVSTAMACVAVPEPIMPVVDGTRVEFAQETGVLTLVHPDGTIYTAKAEGAAEPEQPGELVIPADGGPVIEPIVIGEVGFPTDEGGPLVAVLTDRIVIVTTSPGSVGVSVVSLDLDGTPLPDTTLDVVPEGLPGGAFGGFDGTLYLVTNSETENVQFVHAYQLNGDVWQQVDSTEVTDNNDGIYEVTGKGLQLGDTVVLPAQTEDRSAPELGWTYGQDGALQVFRNNSDGTTLLWDIVEEFENFSIPDTVYPFGDGAIYLGNAAGEDQRYIGVLRADGTNEFFRPGNWQLVAVQGDMALLVQMADGLVTVGALQAN